MDKSFEGLFISVLFHAFLVWLIIFAKLPVYHPVQESPTEVTLVERSDKKAKKQQFVTDPDFKPKPKLEDAKDAADFLSAFTQRVKKQMRAAHNGPTQNAQPMPAQKSLDKSQQGVSGSGQMVAQHQEEDGVGMPAAGKQGDVMHTVAIGQSSIGEYIPGVQEGSFTALNTDQFTYYAFFARMNEQVRYRWVSLIRGYMGVMNDSELQRLGTRDRQTMIEITLGPGGEYRGAIVGNSSGVKRLDEFAADAFQMAAPFPNPPRGMVEKDGLIHLNYAFLVRFGPPTIGPGTN